MKNYKEFKFKDIRTGCFEEQPIFSKTTYTIYDFDGNYIGKTKSNLYFGNEVPEVVRVYDNYGRPIDQFSTEGL